MEKVYKGSKIEIIFAQFLDEYKIRYWQEVEIPELSKCRYDFYLIDYNLLIELQGIQHYEAIADFGGIVEFERRKELDKLKLIKAKKHGYNFLTIKYDKIENTTQYKVITLREVLKLTNKCIKLPYDKLRKFKKRK